GTRRSTLSPSEPFLRLVLAFVFFTFESKQRARPVRSRFALWHELPAHVHRQDANATHDFVASTSGDGPGASSVRAFSNSASSSQRLISLKEKVSPLSVLTSMLTANIKPFSGSVRSSLTSHSPMAMVPPGLSALAVFFSSLRLRSSPSLCRM